MRGHREKAVKLILAMVLLAPGFGAAQHQPSAQLQLSPKRCVALHQGQDCYQTLSIRWQINKAGSYCLQWQGHGEPFHCFNIPDHGNNQQQFEGQIKKEFVGASSRQLQLLSREGQLLAETHLEVAWVYKASSRRKSHWRIF